MKTTTIFALLLTILMICNGYKTENNIWYQTYTLNETLGAINLFTRGRYGFTYVDFSSSTLQNFSIVLFAQNNVIQVLQFSSPNLEAPLIQTNKTVKLISQEKIKTFGNAFNDIDFTVAFPIAYLQNPTVIKIGMSNIFNTRLQ